MVVILMLVVATPNLLTGVCKLGCCMPLLAVQHSYLWCGPTAASCMSCESRQCCITQLAVKVWWHGWEGWGVVVHFFSRTCFDHGTCLDHLYWCSNCIKHSLIARGCHCSSDWSIMHLLQINMSFPFLQNVANCLTQQLHTLFIAVTCSALHCSLELYDSVWCRVIIDAETGLLAHQAQRRNSNEPNKVQRVSMESHRSFGEKPRASSDGSQGGRGSHRLSRESSGANPLPLSCRHSLEAPSIGRKASTTVTEGLLPSVTESNAPPVPEQEVPSPVPTSAEPCAKFVFTAAMLQHFSYCTVHSCQHRCVSNKSNRPH